MARRKIKINMPSTPRGFRNFRDPDHVSSVTLRMGNAFIDALDALCKANGRSRRDIIEILVTEASIEFQQDPAARITPL